MQNREQLINKCVRLHKLSTSLLPLFDEMRRLLGAVEVWGCEDDLAVLRNLRSKYAYFLNAELCRLELILLRMGTTDEQD